MRKHGKGASGMTAMWGIAAGIFIAAIASLVIFRDVFPKVSPQADGHTIIETLVSMQGTTLAVTTIAVTWIGIFVSILSYFQSRKVSDLTRQLEGVRDEFENHIYSIQSYLLNMSSYKMLQESINSEYCYDAMETFQNELSAAANDCKENGYGSEVLWYLNLAQILLREQKLDDDVSSDKKEEIYADIIRISDEILKRECPSRVIRYVIQIKTINAAYQLTRLYEPVDLSKAAESIKKSKELVDEIYRLRRNCDDGLYVDTYGHICNLYGLTYMWWSKIVRTTRNQESKDLLVAVECFRDAISKAERTNQNKNKVSFLNHLGACWINLAQRNFSKCDSYLDYAKESFEKIIAINPGYFKSYLNLGHISMLRVERMIGISSQPTSLRVSARNQLYRNCRRVDFEELCCIADEGLNNLKISIEMDMCEKLPNARYMSVMFLAYKIFVARIQDIDELTDSCISEAKVHIKYLQDKYSCKPRRALFAERMFYEATGQFQNAQMANDEIADYDETNAKAWSSIVSDYTRRR